MKKYILFFCFAFATANSFSQDTSPITKTKDYYSQKSKNQRTTGWILLGTGLAAIGTTLIVNDLDLAYVGISGLASSLASIPFFISAGSNSRKAARVTIGTQKILLLHQKSFVINQQPTISLKIPLGR